MMTPPSRKPLTTTRVDGSCARTAASLQSLTTADSGRSVPDFWMASSRGAAAASGTTIQLGKQLLQQAASATQAIVVQAGDAASVSWPRTATAAVASSSRNDAASSDAFDGGQRGSPSSHVRIDATPLAT